MLKVAEFCTGIGGFRLGIEASNLSAKNVYSNEISNICEKTYFDNFHSKFDSYDLFEIDETQLPSFDMLCAGFPCQPFSQAGQCKGFDDPRGIIIFKLFKIIKYKRPKIVFLENVPNLKSHDKGKTFLTILENIEKLGYKYFYDILDSKYFGVPQSRPRLYIVCFDTSVFGDDIAFSFTKKRTKETSFRNYLDIGNNSIPISERWNEYIDLYTNKKQISDLSFQPPKTRKSLERVSQGCDLEDCVLQIRSSGIRAYSLDMPFPTFAVSVSGGGAMIPVLTRERRHLNMLEMKRLMGFPDDYSFQRVSRTDAIKQLSNAVCPPVIKSICDDINETLKLLSFKTI